MKINDLSTASTTPRFRPLSSRAPKGGWVLCIVGALALGCSTSQRAAESSTRGSAPAADWAGVLPATSSMPKKDKRVARSDRSPTPMMEMAAEADEMAPEESKRSVLDDLSSEPRFNTEAYEHIAENRFVSARTTPLSTFSIDVDTASYSNVRRFLSQGARPPRGAVRIEELINYFDYEYESPTGDEPFSVHTELSTAPWAPTHKLLHIGLQGQRLSYDQLPSKNLVFLLDVSGSMNEPNKLPLLKQSLGALLDTMKEGDTVSMVVYAGATGVVLPPTPAHRRGQIQDALSRLEAGGSTNGGEGIELAYRIAESNLKRGGVNRVILATDGDFNVGTTNQSELVRLIERKRDSGVYLTVLGFGMGNYKDSTLEKLADHGNGNYAYIDTYREAQKVLVEEGGANLVTIAKDVKIQVEMNPSVVGAYRLIGYENRALRAEDFNDDRKDAGEIGAGHTVTALYEIMSPEEAARELDVDALRYGANATAEEGQQKETEWRLPKGEPKDELALVKLRFKAPQGSTSRLISRVVEDVVLVPQKTSDAFRFSAAVAGFGMLLRDSSFRGDVSYQQIARLARAARGRDPFGHKQEFLSLVEVAGRL